MSVIFPTVCLYLCIFLHHHPYLLLQFFLSFQVHFYYSNLVTELLHIHGLGPLFKFRPKLADFYSKKPEVPEGTWPPVKKTHYVNLALIKQTAINFAKDLVRQTVHGSIDDIIKDKEKIDYEDAFDELKDGALVLVEGRPGCGKTTLMHKLSQDWEKRKILVSRLFFLVHFRRFSNMETYDSSIMLDNNSLNPIDMTALGYVVVNSTASLKELAITSCHLGLEGLTAFATVVADHTLAVETLK